MAAIREPSGDQAGGRVTRPSSSTGVVSPVVSSMTSSDPSGVTTAIRPGGPETQGVAAARQARAGNPGPACRGGRGNRASPPGSLARASRPASAALRPRTARRPCPAGRRCRPVARREHARQDGRHEPNDGSRPDRGRAPPATRRDAVGGTSWSGSRSSSGPASIILWNSTAVSAKRITGVGRSGRRTVKSVASPMQYRSHRARCYFRYEDRPSRCPTIISPRRTASRPGGPPREALQPLPQRGL